MFYRQIALYLLKWHFLYHICSLLFTESTLAFSSTYSAKVFSSNVTNLLDILLSNYDRNIRPGLGGPPTTIKVNMNVRSMGPFSEEDESYSMQLYMRQEWFDTRLRFDSTLWGRSDFSMNWMFADRIWKPDTFFINGRDSYFHKITTPNMFIRLRNDGQVMWSMRLTVRATCLMHLRKFPLDTQHCPLKLASYAYNANDVIYTWDYKKLVSVASDVQLAQYELFNITTDNEYVKVRHVEQISTLTVKFHLHRLTGFFLLQVYIPCILIVFSSWVAFWITKENVPGRIGLGVTTVLSLVQLGFGNGPPVDYATAIDYFVMICFAFVFAAVLEYACINFFERHANKRAVKFEKFRVMLKEKIERAATEGRSLFPTTGKPVYKDSIYQLLKVAVSFVPNAGDLALINPDEPDPGDMRGAFKDFLKLAFAVLPNPDALGGEHEKELSLEAKIAQTAAVTKLPLLAVPTLAESTDSTFPGSIPSTSDAKGEHTPPDYPRERRRSRAASIVLCVAEEDPTPPRQVEIWELILKKAKILSRMTPNFVIPPKEDVLERFTMIDYYARRIFPTLFGLMMTLYWYLYQFVITDDFPYLREPSDGLVITPSL